MILKELVDCYDLMVNSDKFEVSDSNFSNEKVSFKITIDEDGLITKIIDLREGSGAKKKTILVNVPYQSGRTSGIKPYFLCDNAKYFFGYEIDSKSLELKRCDQHIEASKNLHMEILDNLDSKYKLILERFFDNHDKNLEIIKGKDPEVLKGGSIILCFKDDAKCIYEQDEVRKAFALYRQNKSENVEEVRGTCLINGDSNTPIAKIHKPIKGVSGSSISGAMIVSFNASSFESYGKSQGYNASVSTENEFKYTTALNKLLSTDDNNMYLSGNTIVFWSSKLGSEEEQLISAFIKDDNDEIGGAEYNQEGVDKIKRIIKLIKKGETVNLDRIKLDDSANMYILGLFGSKSRIFIRFWFKNSLSNFIKLANKHFEDTKLKRRRKNNKKDFIYEEAGVKLSSILKTITPYGKSQNTPKTLINSLFKSILTGGFYPISIYNKILERIRAESGEDFAVNHTRVSFIKGYLKRKKEEVTVSLNKESKNVSYNLGRIFAILEKIQMDSNGSTNIREKYLSSASSTPKSIFPNLLNLAQYHIAKINKENNTKFNYYDKIIGEILLNVNEFPAVFSSDEQGMFILGYYHQREDIYTPKKDKEEN